MENTKRARKEKSRIRPSGGTYVEPKDLLSGLERVREAARRRVVQERGWDATRSSDFADACEYTCTMFWTCGWITYPAPISESTSLRYTPEVGAQCISSACLGSVRGVPGNRHSYRD